MRRERVRILAAMALGLTVLMTACAPTSPPGPQIQDVSGVWIGDWQFQPAGTGRGIFTMTLKQAGTDVAGAIQMTGLDRTSPTQVTGVLQGDEIRLVGMASNGVVKVTGNQMTGRIERDGQVVTIVATRQGD